MAIRVFLCFAFTYFLSTLVRAITATLSPTLIPEFGLQARDLGLLAGGYFLGFSIMQLPMGRWLDQQGPKKVVLYLLLVAVVGSFAFAMADSFMGLFLARVLTGVGVSACLMAPLTGYRRWLAPTAQLRANSWMLMTGSLGMLASTLPVQWLVPLVGWRFLFVVMAGLLAVSMIFILWQVPNWTSSEPPGVGDQLQNDGLWASYAEVWRHPYFQRMTPLGFFSYGGMVAMQTLWAGPWLTKVSGWSAMEAATGLFWINVSMLSAFWLWGMLNPLLARLGWSANRLITCFAPVQLVMMLILIVGGAESGLGIWVAYFVANTVVSLAQPAVGLAFSNALAGRALSAYNLVIFAGVFVIQWGVGLIIDMLGAAGWSTVAAFQGAFSFFLGLSVLSYGFFLYRGRGNLWGSPHPAP